jgi:hypothetical protein
MCTGYLENLGPARLGPSLARVLQRTATRHAPRPIEPAAQLYCPPRRARVQATTPNCPVRRHLCPRCHCPKALPSPAKPSRRTRGGLCPGTRPRQEPLNGRGCSEGLGCSCEEAAAECATTETACGVLAADSSGPPDAALPAAPPPPTAQPQAALADYPIWARTLRLFTLGEEHQRC